jgi:hypothetical protein
LDAGAKVIEKLIAKSLCTRLGLNFTERASWTLIDYVNSVRQETQRAVAEC